MSLEVERKFLCSDEALKTLEEEGVCVGQRRFHDQYFDTSTFDLTLKDVWLRKREGCWELKRPAIRTEEEPSGCEAEAASLCTRYEEITGLPEVQLRVRELMKDKKVKEEREPDVEGGCQSHASPEEHKEDQSWLEEMSLGCFAEFTTVRRSFALEEDGVQIDLDQADFGYSVGEIEVLVSEGGDVQSALERIERTARRLGLTGDQRVAGKMNVYLERNRPEHYAKLLSAHVL